jgi:lipopolysaccharide transport system ATP-binding protein
MSEVAGGGRTVLFVSHNMSAMRALCTKGLLLASGRIKISGMPNDIIESYTSQSQDTMAFIRSPKQSEKPMVVGVSWVRPAHPEVSAVNRGTDIEVVISACHRTPVSIDLRLKDGYSNPVGFGSLGHFQSERCPVVLNSGINKVLLHLSTDRLAVGEYQVSVDLTHPYVEYFDRVEDCIRFQISSNPVVGSGWYLEQRWGYGCAVLPLHVKSLPLSTNEDQPSQIAEADASRR